MRLVFKKVARSGWGQSGSFDHHLRLKGKVLARVTQMGIRGGGSWYWYGGNINTLNLKPCQTWESLDEAKKACKDYVRKKLEEGL